MSSPPDVFNESWEKPLLQLINATPPGHLSEVLQNLRTLTQAAIPSDFLEEVCRNVNEINLYPLPLEEVDGTSVICHSARRGRTEANTYLDSRSGKLFVVDHVAQSCVRMQEHEAKRSAGADISKAAEKNRDLYQQAVQEELDLYAAAKFPPAKMSSSAGRPGQAQGCAGAAVHGRAEDDGSLALQVVYSSRCLKPKGKWSGSWNSDWIVRLVPGQKEDVRADGDVSIRTYYAEQGNVQFSSKMKKRVKVSGAKSPEAFAKAMVESFRQCDDELVDQLDASIVSMVEDGLKDFRRVLPVTRTKFDWIPASRELMAEMDEAKPREDDESEDGTEKPASP